MADKTYSTVEVCELFQIHKSTLFRWERDGLLRDIPRVRGQRQFGKKHLRAISELKLKALRREYEYAARREDIANLQNIQQQISWYKFLGGTMLGMVELKQFEKIPDEMIVRLLRVAVDRFTPKDQVFWDIIEIVHGQRPKEAGYDQE